MQCTAENHVRGSVIDREQCVVCPAFAHVNMSDSVRGITTTLKEHDRQRTYTCLDHRQGHRLPKVAKDF